MMIQPQVHKYKNLYEAIIEQSNCPECNETLSIVISNLNITGETSGSNRSFLIKGDELEFHINNIFEVDSQIVIICNIYTNVFYIKNNKTIDGSSYLIRQDCKNCESYSKSLSFVVLDNIITDITLVYQYLSWTDKELLFEMENLYNKDMSRLSKHAGPNTITAKLQLIHFTTNEINKFKRRINELLPYS